MRERGRVGDVVPLGWPSDRRCSSLGFRGGEAGPGSARTERLTSCFSGHRSRAAADLDVKTRFHWALTVRDILEFYGRIYGLDAASRRQRTRELVGFFGLQNTLDKKFDRLSTWERMRLVFAKALLHRPSLLLLDEPTLGLDPDMAIRIRREILRINQEFRTTLFLTSHYMQEVEQLAQRAAFIHRGKILEIGTPRELKSRRFGTSHLVVRVKEPVDARYWQRLGFEVTPGQLTREVRTEEELHQALALLAGNRLEIVDLEHRKPTLEDYFVEMLQEQDSGDTPGASEKNGP